MLHQPIVSHPIQKSQTNGRNDRSAEYTGQPFGLLVVQGVEAIDGLVDWTQKLAVRLHANLKKDRQSAEGKLEVADRLC